MPSQILGAAAAPVTAIAGNIAASGDADKAQALQQQALQAIQDVNVPDVDKMKLILQQYQSAGQLSPQMEQVIAQDPSLMNKVNADPRLQDAQMNALNKLAQVGTSGQTMQGQQLLDQIQRASDTSLRGQQQAILQNAQQRGEGGSGASLAAQLSGAQNAANSNAQQGLQVGSQLQQQALQAIMNQGGLAGQMSAQQFNQAAQKAAAQDAINRFNAANSQQVAGTNTSIGNQAQAANLAQKQQLMNSNTDLANKQQQYNAQLLQQDYQNKLQKAQGVYGAQQNMANQLNGYAQNTRNMWGSIGQGAGQMIMAGGAKGSQANTTTPNFGDVSQGSSTGGGALAGGEGEAAGSLAEDAAIA